MTFKLISISIAYAASSYHIRQSRFGPSVRDRLEDQGVLSLAEVIKKRVTSSLGQEMQSRSVSIGSHLCSLAQVCRPESLPWTPGCDAPPFFICASLLVPCVCCPTQLAFIFQVNTLCPPGL